MAGLKLLPWVLVNLIQLLAQYPSGLSEAVLKSELEVLWEETDSDFHYGNRKWGNLGFGSVNGIAVASLGAQLLSQPPASVFTLDADLKYELTVVEVGTLPGSTINRLVVTDKDPGTLAKSPNFRIECVLHTRFLPVITRGLLSLPSNHPYGLVYLRLAGSLTVNLINGHLGRVLPTHNLIFELPAGRDQFVSVLGADPLLSLADLQGGFASTDQVPSFHPIGVWVKVARITKLDPHRLNRVVRVIDGTCKAQVPLVFPEPQTPLVETLEVGGYLGLWHPHISRDGGQLVLEVGLNTILFYTQLEDVKGADGSAGFCEPQDQQYRVPRITLNEIAPGMTNVTLPVRVVTLTCNIRLEDPTGYMHDRCTLVVEDPSGVANITFWERAVASVAADCMPGHLILLHRISCPFPEDQPPNGKLFINAHPDEGFQLINISTLKGAISTPSVTTRSLLSDLETWTANQDPASKLSYFVGGCVVVSCVPVVIPGALQDASYFTVQTRKRFFPPLANQAKLMGNSDRHCRQPVKPYHANQLVGETRVRVLGDYVPHPLETVYHCEYCRVCISQFESQTELDRCFSLAWLLDDGSQQTLSYGFWKASLDILKISPDELLLSSGTAKPPSPPPACPVADVRPYPEPQVRNSPPRPHAPGSPRRNWAQVLGGRHPAAMRSGFPFPAELGFAYSLNMALPSKAILPSTRLLELGLISQP
ncbi:hypothetical protein L0F63_003661 [Massospora cicadina]|nr:hypothetical protein L0F63_003661 [Massospora cicadina]